MVTNLTKSLIAGSLVIAGATIGATAQGFYELNVIADRGGESIDDYLPNGQQSLDHMKQVYDQRPRGKYTHALFPIVTKAMTVGPVTQSEANKINFQMVTRPMFIIGYDRISMQWLAANNQQLRDKRAIGLVVNVQTAQQMEELKHIAGEGILMQPVSGDRLAESLNIKHYPFYMDRNGVLR